MESLRQWNHLIRLYLTLLLLFKVWIVNMIMRDLIWV